MPKDKKRKDEPAGNNNMLLILGGIGCAGLVLILCVASAGVGYWFYSKKDLSKDGVAQNKDKDSKSDAGKDGGDKKSKLRKDYDKIKMGDSADTIKTMMGGRGNVGSEGVPLVSEKGVGPKIAKEKSRLGVNVIWSWQDPAAGETLVVGFQEDVVGFKGLYYTVGTETKVDYVFTTTKK
jgi:hypothetical protein